MFNLFGDKKKNWMRYAQSSGHVTEILNKSLELCKARKYDEATPLLKSGIEYMQKHFGDFNINEQMVTDFDAFFKQKYKNKESEIELLSNVVFLDLPQTGKIIEEYLNIVKPKIGDDTAANLAVYLYLLKLDSFNKSWNEVLKSRRPKQ